MPNTSLVGRDDAVDRVVEALGSHRVVTLIGVGGVGKTRLALQAGAMLAPGFRDGVWLIELAPVTDGAGVDAAVASVFTLQPQPGRSCGPTTCSIRWNRRCCRVCRCMSAGSPSMRRQRSPNSTSTTSSMFSIRWFGSRCFTLIGPTPTCVTRCWKPSDSSRKKSWPAVVPASRFGTVTPGTSPNVPTGRSSSTSATTSHRPDPRRSRRLVTRRPGRCRRKSVATRAAREAGPATGRRRRPSLVSAP